MSCSKRISCRLTADKEECVGFEPSSWQHLRSKNAIEPDDAIHQCIYLAANTEFAVDYSIAKKRDLSDLKLLNLRVRIDGELVANDCVHIGNFRGIVLKYTGTLAKSINGKPRRILVTNKYRSLKYSPPVEDSTGVMRRGRIQVDFYKAFLDDQPYKGQPLSCIEEDQSSHNLIEEREGIATRRSTKAQLGEDNPMPKFAQKLYRMTHIDTFVFHYHAKSILPTQILII